MIMDNEINDIYEEETYLPPPRSGLKKELAEWRLFAYYRAIWLRHLPALGYKPSAPLDALDIGCGAGDFIASLQKVYPKSNVIGIDLNRKLVEYAHQRLDSAEFSQTSAQELPFASSRFDLIVSNQVVEHLPQPERFFAECHRLLRPSGVLMFSTPNLNGLSAKLLGGKWTGYRYDHIALGTVADWRGYCRRADFRLIKDGTTGLTGFPIMRRFPFSLISYIPLMSVGFLPWQSGEAYMAIVRKPISGSR